MKVIVQKSFGRHSVGDVIPEMPANQARLLIARGLARELADKDVQASPVDRMMRAGVRKARA